MLRENYTRRLGWECGPARPLLLILCRGLIHFPSTMHIILIGHLIPFIFSIPQSESFERQRWRILSRNITVVCIYLFKIVRIINYIILFPRVTSMSETSSFLRWVFSFLRIVSRHYRQCITFVLNYLPIICQLIQPTVIYRTTLHIATCRLYFFKFR